MKDYKKYESIKYSTVRYIDNNNGDGNGNSNNNNNINIIFCLPINHGVAMMTNDSALHQSIPELMRTKIPARQTPTNYPLDYLDYDYSVCNGDKFGLVGLGPIESRQLLSDTPEGWTATR